MPHGCRYAVQMLSMNDVDEGAYVPDSRSFAHARSNVCGTQHMADALITTGPRSSGWPPSSRLQYLRRFLVPRAQLYHAIPAHCNSAWGEDAQKRASCSECWVTKQGGIEGHAPACSGRATHVCRQSFSLQLCGRDVGRGSQH